MGFVQNKPSVNFPNEGSFYSHWFLKEKICISCSRKSTRLEDMYLSAPEALKDSVYLGVKFQNSLVCLETRNLDG